MLKGFDENGNLKDVVVTEEGKVKVKLEDSVTVGNTSSNAIPVNMQNESIVVGNTSQNAVPVNMQNASIIIGNTAQSPIPVDVTNTEEIETTLNASVQTVGTTATTIAVNKKVTSIDVANYSATASLTITVGNLQYVVGGNIAVSLPVNKNVTNLGLVSNEADTKVQIIVKGVE